MLLKIWSMIFSTKQLHLLMLPYVLFQDSAKRVSAKRDSANWVLASRVSANPVSANPDWTAVTSSRSVSVCCQRMWLVDRDQRCTTVPVHVTRHSLNWTRYVTGSQWRWTRNTCLIWLCFLAPMVNRAAVFSTDCSWLSQQCGNPASRLLQ